jgi:VanZ family protein
MVMSGDANAPVNAWGGIAMGTTLLWLPLVATGYAIYSLSSIPYPAFVSQHQAAWLEVYGHLIPYGLLGFFVARFLSRGSRISVGKLVACTTAICASFGMFDEFHQTLTTTRTAEFSDLFVDSIGGAIGGMLFLTVHGLFSRVGRVEDTVRLGAVYRVVLLTGAVTLAVVFPKVFVTALEKGGLAEPMPAVPASIGVQSVQLDTTKPAGGLMDMVLRGVVLRTDGQSRPDLKISPSKVDLVTQYLTVQAFEAAQGIDAVANLKNQLVNELARQTMEELRREFVPAQPPQQ